MRFVFVDKRLKAQAFTQLVMGIEVGSHVIEDVELSDCHTVEQAINQRYGSTIPEWLECHMKE